MPIGVTLSELRRELRAEIGHSLSIAQGVNYQDSLDAALRRTQQELWSNYTWDHLVFTSPQVLPMSQRFYTLPTELDQVQVVEVSDMDNGFRPLVNGVGPPQYAEINSITGATSWPVKRWAMSPLLTAGVATPTTSRIEVWPIPSRAANLLFSSQAQLPPLILDTDRCALDSYAVTLFAAALILSRQENEDAAPTQARAQEYVRRLRAGGGARKKPIRTLANASSMYSQAPMRPGIDYIA